MSTKIWQISQFCVDVKAKLEDFVNFFCGLLGKYKAYPKRKVHKPHVMKKKIRGGRGSKTVDFETALFMEGPLVFYTAPQPRPGWPSRTNLGWRGPKKSWQIADMYGFLLKQAKDVVLQNFSKGQKLWILKRLSLWRAP